MSRGRTVNSVFPSDRCLTCRRPRTLGSSSARAVGLSGSRIPHAFECDPARNSATLQLSDRLDLLAEQHPLVSDELIGISGSIRNTATLLEVVVAMKMPTFSSIDPANA